MSIRSCGVRVTIVSMVQYTLAAVLIHSWLLVYPIGTRIKIHLKINETLQFPLENVRRFSTTHDVSLLTKAEALLIGVEEVLFTFKQSTSR